MMVVVIVIVVMMMALRFLHRFPSYFFRHNRVRMPWLLLRSACISNSLPVSREWEGGRP